jgi:NAD(P)-dependent dehydrogenase (short-subunit alcohol dehydrogenase family)
MDGPFSGRVALITGASGGTGQALARRPATGGAVPGPGYSARGQAAQALAAEITPAGGTAPAIGATCAARRPQSAHPGGRRSAGPG